MSKIIIHYLIDLMKYHYSPLFTIIFQYSGFFITFLEFRIISMYLSKPFPLGSANGDPITASSCEIAYKSPKTSLLSLLQ